MSFKFRNPFLFFLFFALFWEGFFLVLALALVLVLGRGGFVAVY